jgi:hypothetical protein
MGKSPSIDDSFILKLNWADSPLPRDALVVAGMMSGAIKYYNGRPIVRFERVEADQWQRFQTRAAEKGYRWYALLVSNEIDEAQRRMPGRWINLGLWRIETGDHP